MSIIEQYRECAEAGMTIAETAAKFGKDYATVGGAARRHGFRFQPESVYGKRLGPDAYRACAEAGMTRQQTADHLGVCIESVYGAAKRHGLQFVSAQKRFAARHPEIRMNALRKAWEAHA